MRMTKEEFDRELKYQVVMYFTKKMLMEALTTEDEYRQIDAICNERYKPATGNLLSGKFLLLSEISANKNKTGHHHCEQNTEDEGHEITNDQ